MKKVKILGKAIPVFVLVLLGIGMVSALVLDYFGVLNQEVTVGRAVIFGVKDGANCPVVGDDMTCEETTPTIYGGETATSDEYILTSKTSVEVPITLETEVLPDESGITTSIVGTLKLIKKDTTTWIPVSGTGKWITYTIVGNVFESSGVPEGYTLIYYKDKGTYTTDAERLLVLGKSAILSANMPHGDDWNAGEFANYCGMANGFDDYEHCRGAKLWAVPDANIVGGALVWSSPEDFYFETELIEYNKEGEITIYPDEVLDFKVKTTFSTANTGIYTVTTKAQV